MTKLELSDFLSWLSSFTFHKDRHIKGHSTALLKRLQELNPQDND